jgi:hypothetical protein
LGRDSSSESIFSEAGTALNFCFFFFKKKEVIKGVICGYRIEEIDNPLTRQVRYLDKIVDELAKGRKMEKILREDK